MGIGMGMGTGMGAGGAQARQALLGRCGCVSVQERMEWWGQCDDHDSTRVFCVWGGAA
jgi:hypothetical protein